MDWQQADSFMDWQQADRFGQDLRAAFDAVLRAPEDSGSLVSFESLLADLYQHYDQARVDRLGLMADELSERLESDIRPKHPDVARFVERLPEVMFSPSSHTADVVDMLLWVREILSAAKG